MESPVSKVVPLGDRLLLEALPEVRQRGLIVVVDRGKNLDVKCSRVIARGPGVKAKPWDLGVGDFVLTIKSAGVVYDGGVGPLASASEMGRGDYRFVRESEILAVVDPKAVESVTGSAFFDEKGTRELASL